MAKRAEKTTYQFIKVGRKTAAIKCVATSEIFVPMDAHPAGRLGGLIDGCTVSTFDGKPFVSLADMLEIWRKEKTEPGKETKLKLEMIEGLEKLPGQFEIASAK